MCAPLQLPPSRSPCRGPSVKIPIRHYLSNSRGIFRAVVQLVSVLDRQQSHIWSKAQHTACISGAHAPFIPQVPRNKAVTKVCVPRCVEIMHVTYIYLNQPYCLHRFSCQLSAHKHSARGASKLSVLLGIYSRPVWQKQQCFPTERGASSLEQFTGPISIFEATHNAGHLH